MASTSATNSETRPLAGSSHIGSARHEANGAHISRQTRPLLTPVTMLAAALVVALLAAAAIIAVLGARATSYQSEAEQYLPATTTSQVSQQSAADSSSGTAGGPCREYTKQVMIGGKMEAIYGTACRQPDGTWNVSN